MWQNRGWKVLYDKRPWPRQPFRRDCIDQQCKTDVISEIGYIFTIIVPFEGDLHSNLG